MSHRPLLRFLAMIWASVQLMAPGLSAVADGMLMRQGGYGEARAHVEETTGAACPAAHSPDCGICRYLTDSGADAPRSQVVASLETGAGLRAPALSGEPRGSAPALPFGRGPPSV